MELAVLRHTDHGEKFISTVKLILNSILNSILCGEMVKTRELMIVIDILESYSAFDFHVAHRKYASFRMEFRNFVVKMRWDPSYTTKQVRAWAQIERILLYLVEDGQRFLDISEGRIPL